MSKLFVGKWKILDGPPLGRDGRNQVYRVMDATGEYQDEYALKRVLKSLNVVSLLVSQKFAA